MLWNKKLVLSLLLIILLGFAISGCKNTEKNDIQSLKDEIENLTNINTELFEENDSLNTQNNELKESLQVAKEAITNLQNDINEIKKKLDAKQYEMFPPAISYGYLGYNPDFYVFVEKETYIKMLPYDNAQNVNIVFEKSLVRVLDKAQFQSDEEIDNEKYWYYVEVTVYDTPLNTRGWIRVEETVPYTKENQQNVLSPVRVKDGSKIYEQDSPFNNDHAKYTLAVSEGGAIEEYHEGYVRIMSNGGRDFWTKLENIIYPDIK